MAEAEAEAETRAKVRYVYVQTTLHLWRFDFQGTDTNYEDDSSQDSSDEDDEGKERGALTKLIDFRENLVPLGAGGFLWNSKLFFVGGETVKPDTIPVEMLPWGPFETEEEFESIYGFNNHNDPDVSIEELRKLYHDPDGGFLKLPRSSLNKRVFVLDTFYDSNSEPILPSLSNTGSESLAPKTWPLVVPIKKEDRTLIYVIANSPLFYKFDTSLPSFEVYDPALDSWEQLDEPPYRGRGISYTGTFFPAKMAFELSGKIFLFSAYGGGLFEMCFDIETKKWERSNVFEGKSHYVPMYIFHLSGDVYIGCKGTSIFAYKYCPGSPIGIQRLVLLSRSCRPSGWHCISQPHSQVCHLGNGLVLFVCTSLKEPDEDYLLFRFARFQISMLSEDDPEYGRNDFVLYQFVDSFDKRVAREDTPLIYDDSILQLYLL